MIVTTRRLAEVLIVGWFVVVAAGLVVELLRFGSVGEFALADSFSLSLEANVPTWYSSVVLFSCALALLAVANDEAAAGQTRWRFHWRGLALAFFAISMDEVASFHEHINAYGHFGGILYYAWVIPFGAAVVVIGVLCLPFLTALPTTTRNRFIGAGVLYVGGALGVELVLGAWTAKHGQMNFTYRLIDVVEESGEIAGASLFLWSLLVHRSALQVARAAEASA